MKTVSITISLLLAFTLLFATGCSCSAEEPKEPESASSGQAKEVEDTPAPASEEEVSPAAATLQTIINTAAEGMVINCEYAVSSTTIDAVETAWGAADSSDYVAAADGTYYTYSAKNTVFGANKGMLVFEIRSFDPSLATITYGDVTTRLGTPEYTGTTTVGETVIGYTLAYDGAAGSATPSEVKIEFVFESADSSAPINHYNVFDPAQTVNYMANDSGRVW